MNPPLKKTDFARSTATIVDSTDGLPYAGESLWHFDAVWWRGSPFHRFVRTALRAAEQARRYVLPHALRVD